MTSKTTILSAATALMLLLASARAADTPAAPTVTIGHAPAGASVIDAQTGPAGSINLLFQKNNAPFYAASKDNGKTFSKPLPVISQKIAVPGLEFLGWNMAVGANGKVFVVTGNNAWKLKNVPDNQKGMFLSMLEPGAKAFSPTVPLNGAPSEGFSIAAGKDGNVTAAYLRGKLFWKHSISDGKTFTVDEEIDKDYLPCTCCTTSTAYGSDGTLAVLYREAGGNRRDIYAILSKDGKKTRVPVSRTLWEIDACPMTYFKIAPTKTGFVMAWPTRQQVYFTRMTNDGKIWKPREIKVGGKTGMRSSVFALGGANDTTLVAWKNENLLHWRIFDSAGKPLGQEAHAPGPGPQAGGVVDEQGNYVLFP